ncbi:hypothetical protein LXL04_017214 [Taraxacum kok-saghyz]
MVSLVKQVASTTNSAVGDGTNCATVLTQAIFTEGGKSVAAGVNVMRLTSNDKYIRRNYTGERDIGELIATAMEKVGKEGIITVVDGNTLFNELEVVEGMKLGRGYISPYFVTNTMLQKCPEIRESTDIYS